MQKRFRIASSVLVLMAAVCPQIVRASTTYVHANFGSTSLDDRGASFAYPWGMGFGLDSPDLVPNNGAGFGGAQYIFVTGDGTISTWSDGMDASVQVDYSSSGAIFTGITLLGNRLYASDFGTNRIRIFDSSFKPVSIPGGFTDPTLPADFAPLGIQTAGDQVVVTYAQENSPSEPGVPPSSGIVDVFDANGVLQHRLTGNDPAPSPGGASGALTIVATPTLSALSADDPAPEPASIWLMLTGVVCLSLWRLRQRSADQR
jgi:uncharacterized protein (TIGR03118 family)